MEVWLTGLVSVMVIKLIKGVLIVGIIVCEMFASIGVDVVVIRRSISPRFRYFPASLRTGGGQRLVLKCGIQVRNNCFCL